MNINHNAKLLFIFILFFLAMGLGFSQNDNNQPQDEQVIQLPSGTKFSLYAVCSTDNNTAYAVGEGGTIIKTVDAGKSWKTLPSGVSETLWSVFFINQNTGYAAGTNGIILKTVNAGNNWMKMNSGINSELKCIYFTDASNGFASGIFGTLLRTKDGGSTWEKISLNTDKWLKDIFFSSKTTGYICGWGGQIFKTTDGGNTWNLLESTTNKILESIFFPSADEGYAVGWGGTFMKTTDKGESWSFMSMPNNNDLSDLYYIDDKHLLVVGYMHSIQYTMTSGDDWNQINTNCSADFFDITSLGDDAVLIAGSGGTLLKITFSEKQQKKELTKYWSGNENAYDVYDRAEDCYAKKDYPQALELLDSAATLLGKDNETIRELRIKCLNDEREYALTMKEIGEYLSMKPDTSSDFFKHLDKYSSNMEKKISDEADWKEALADSSAEALNEYLLEHPNGIFKNDAADEMLWIKTKNTNNPEDYDEYLKQFSNGKHAALAQELRTYYLAVRDHNSQLYEEYQKSFPKGRFINEVSDSLKIIYLRLGDESMQRRNPGEAEQWFKKYEQSFAGSDTTDIITKKLDEVEQLKKELEDERMHMQQQQQKAQMENSLKWERRHRDRKLIKASIWGSVTAASLYGSYYFFSKNKILVPALTCSAFAIVGVFTTKNSFRDVFLCQKNVKKIREDIHNLNISAVVNPLYDFYGMTLRLNFN